MKLFKILGDENPASCIHRYTSGLLTKQRHEDGRALRREATVLRGVYEIRVSPGYLQFAPDTTAERDGHCMGNG